MEVHHFTCHHSRHGKPLIMKTENIILLIWAIVFIIITFFSLFYIIEHPNQRDFDYVPYVEQNNVKMEMGSKGYWVLSINSMKVE